MKHKANIKVTVPVTGSKTLSHSDKINQLFAQKQAIVKSVQSKNLKDSSQSNSADPVLEWL